MKKSLLFVLLCLVVLLAGCGRIKRKLSGSSHPKAPPKDPFYTYDGFRDWYRFPLKYPYQVMMIDNYDDGYLQEFEGGSIEENSCSVLVDCITDLHLHEDYAFFRKDDWTFGYLQYSTGEIRLFKTEEELKQTCFLEAKDFKPLEYYYKLFRKDVLMYPPPDPATAKPEEVRFDVIAHFHGVAVKMYLGGLKADPYIRVSYGDEWDYVDIQTGKARHGHLPPEAQEMIDKWLPLHRDELLEMWKTQKRKVLPPLE